MVRQPPDHRQLPARRSQPPDRKPPL